MTWMRVGKATESLFGKEGWVLRDPTTQVVIVAAALSTAGVFLVSPIISELTGPLAVTEARAGQIITVFTAPSIFLVPIMGFLADRYSRKIVLFVGLVLFGAAGAGVGLVNSFEAILILRFVQGIGSAAIYPITITLLGDLYVGAQESTAQGMHSASIQVIGLITPLLGGGLVILSWRVPFLLYGSALFVAAWVWITIPTVAPTESTPFGSYLRDLAHTIKKPTTALVIFSFFIRFVLSFSFFAFISILVIHTTGRTALASGVVVSVFSFAALIAATQAGRLVARFDEMVCMIGGFLFMGISMAVMGGGVSYGVLLVSVLFFGIGGGITAPIQKSLITQVAPGPLRAGAVSTAEIFRGIGQTAGPFFMGISLQFVAVGTSFIVFGIGCAIVGSVIMGIAYLIDRSP